MDKIKNGIRKYSLRWIIIFCSVLFLCGWVAGKEGFHMDEVLAFELANAEYNPWIVPTQPQGRLAKFWNEHIEGESLLQSVENVVYILKDTLSNRGSSILATYKADVYEAPVWISGETFQNYITVNEDDDFNFFSVYFNVKDDDHPPIHYMLMHLVSSIFKEQVSPWMGCSINLVAMAICMWLLGKIGEELGLKESGIAAVMILFGFSTGIVASTLWIRMYGLLTMWVVWVLYMHLKLWNRHGFARLKGNGKAKLCGHPGLLWLTLLMFWTQYFGLFFLFPLAAVTVIALWKSGRSQEMWAYVRTMIIAAVIGVGVFPFVILDVFLSQRGQEVLTQWGSGMREYMERIAAFWKIIGVNTVGNAWILVVVLIVPVIIWFVLKVRGRMSENNAAAAAHTDSVCNPVAAMMLIVPTLVYFLLASKVSPFFVDRYVMPVFPMLALLIILLWNQVGDCLTTRFAVYLLPALALVLVIAQAVERQGTHTYLYTGYNKQIAQAREYSQYPLVCYYEGHCYYENIVEMGHYQQTLLVKPHELEQMDEERRSVTQSGYVLLVKDADEQKGREQLELVMEVFGGSNAEFLMLGESWSDAFYLITP